MILFTLLQSTKFSIIISIFIIITWWLYGTFVYRNSPERIGRLAMSKYSVLKKPNEGTYFSVGGVDFINSENIILNILIKDKRTAKVLDTDTKYFKIGKNCDFDINCIEI